MGTRDVCLRARVGLRPGEHPEHDAREAGDAERHVQYDANHAEWVGGALGEA